MASPVAEYGERHTSWCTEREGRIIDFWVAFSDAVIIVRKLI